MKTIHYKGFHDCKSCCQYAIGEIDGKKALVFHTDKIQGTSVTNLIEDVTNQILSSDLPGISPEHIRVFEHYSPQLEPIWEWMEVQFESFSGGKSKQSLLEKLKSKILSTHKDENYYVHNPQWKPISKKDKQTLSKLLE